MTRRAALARLGAAAVLTALFGAARAAPEPDRLTVVAVGDVMMGTTWPTDVLPPQDGRGLFAAVSPYLKGRDLVFGNLEGPLLDGGKAAKCGPEASGRCFEFRTPRRYAAYLAEAGFHVMNVANNHAFDFGAEGVGSTVEALRSANLQAAGGELAPRLLVRGRWVCVVGFSASPASRYSLSVRDLDRAREAVGRAKARGDLVVVSMHAGAEGKGALHVADEDELFAGENRGNVVRFARAAVDAGADLVVGHGPHVPRAMELRRGKLIAYSLGNFLTFGRFNTKGPNGLGALLEVELDPRTGDFLAGRITSADLQETGIPRPDPEGRAWALVRSLTREDFPSSGLAFEPDGRILPAPPLTSPPAPPSPPSPAHPSEAGSP